MLTKKEKKVLIDAAEYRLKCCVMEYIKANNLEMELKSEQWKPFCIKYDKKHIIINYDKFEYWNSLG